MKVFEKATYAKIIFSYDDVDDEDSFAYYHYASRPDNRPIIVSDISDFKSWIVKLNPALKLFLVIHIGAENHEKKSAEKNSGKYIKYSCETFIEALKESFPSIKYALASRDPKPEDKSYFSAEIWDSDAVMDLNESHPAQIIQEILPPNDNSPLKKPFKLDDNVPIDFAIVTALYYDEMEEVKRAFDINTSSRIEFGNNIGYSFEFNRFKVLAVSQAEMGMVDSAILSTELMMRFNPKYLIMPGVCGGDSKLKFGDIVISKKVHLFQAGKLKEDGFDKESVEVKMDNVTIKKIQDRGKDIVTEIKNELKNTSDPDLLKFKKYWSKGMSIHFEPTACSTMIIDKKHYFEEVIKEIDRKMVAVEMEGYGIARANEYLLCETKAILIKCVMDKTTKKDDDAKPYAAYVSAQFVKKLIEKNVLL